MTPDPGAPGARPGAGQAEDNYVHRLACGHEHDAPEQLAIGNAVRCSQHGWSPIVAN